jgi:Cellulase (glycosyl hydrolase family 5)
VLAAVVAVAGVVAAPSRSGAESASAVRAARGLHVVGNRLVSGTGRRIRLHGVNRSGTEYACIQGWGIFDGPHDAASVRAIASWHANFVRVPLNEDCWLGINGVKPEYAGAAYRNAIVAYVKLLRAYGLYAELSLIWAAPGSNKATYQPGAPDADHSPAMWASLARTFRNHYNVVLAPWGESVVNADCFLRGGVCEATYGTKNVPYRTAGMQQAVTLMRRAGYTGVISIPGITYANDLSKWLSHMPKDPRRQLIAEAHVYGKNTCDSPSCLNASVAPVARRVPVILGETGETYDASDCGTAHISQIIPWADAHGVGWAAWTWDTWGNCSALIGDYASAKPFSAYATWIKNRLTATRAAAPPLPRGRAG